MFYKNVTGKNYLIRLYNNVPENVFGFFVKMNWFGTHLGNSVGMFENHFFQKYEAFILSQVIFFKNPYPNIPFNDYPLFVYNSRIPKSQTI
jgi:hypothetical protein